MEPTPLQRALKDAPLRSPPERARPEQEYFCFEVGELRLAVPSANIREVMRVGPMTPLPRMPSFVLGVTGHRGEVHPVVDLLRFLGKGEARVTPRSRLFIGVHAGYAAAFLADLVIGLRQIEVADILPPPVGGDASTEHLVGVVAKGDGPPLSLLNFVKLLQTARQRVMSR